MLLQNKSFKLCDFGSASVSTLNYGSLPAPNHIDTMMEDFEKHTTMMYRPPEMIDKYLRYNVDT